MDEGCERSGYSCVATLKGESRAVASVHWRPRGEELLSTSGDAKGRVWKKVDDAWENVVKLDGHREGLNDAVWWRDGTLCATASDDKTVRLWDVETAKTVVVYEGHESYVFCVDLNPQNTLLCTGSFDETVKYWDVRCKTAVATMNAHQDPVTGVSFDRSDGAIVASSSFDGLVRLWDVKAGECLATMFAETDTHPPAATRVVYSDNGRFVLSGHHDAQLRLWYAAEPPCAHAQSYTGHEASRFCAACGFHNVRGAVVAGSEDGRLLLWDLQTAKLLHDIKAHDDAVLAVDAHPNTDLIATGGMTNDPHVKIWRWQKLMATPPGDLGSNHVQKRPRLMPDDDDDRAAAAQQSGPGRGVSSSLS